MGTQTAAAYELVIGIETHVQLRTASKMFCGCSTAFGAPPNSQTCPVCLGHPGVLPVINQGALEKAILAGLALNCRIADYTKFDRKNYYYPDLPKNYQISQYDLPLAKDGWVEFDVKGALRKVGIERLHMEEDAGKLLHEEGGARSYVDLNRAGTPLCEIVTRPDMRTPEEAAGYMNALRTIMRTIEVSECDMEKGEFRCDVNISVRPQGSDKFGTKVEIKNLNSFKFAADAIRYEFDRQVKALESGQRIIQETRQFDSTKGVTVSMRTKEGVADYRYFPEPDLPPLKISREQVEAIRAKLPELPMPKKRRFMEQYALSDYDAGILVVDKRLAGFYEEAAKLSGKPKVIANWVLNEILKIMNEQKLDMPQIKTTPQELVALLSMLESGRINNTGAKTALQTMVLSGKPAEQIVKESGLEQVSDAGAIEAAVDQAIRDNPKVIADIKGGKDSAGKFLIGYVMKLTKGRANVQVVTDLLKKKLG